MHRRLLQVHGVVAVNSWGGPTKEFEVAVDPRKLEAYGVTLPQILAALGNANVNVGGREITMGQQSDQHPRGRPDERWRRRRSAPGLQGRRHREHVISQYNGIPLRVKDVAKVEVGTGPGSDRADATTTTTWFGIVVMKRDYQTDQVLPELQAEIERMNGDGSLPPGVKVVPYYDRGALVAVTTHTVMHNLIFGCLLIFLIQWIFLGDLRSAIIVGLKFRSRCCLRSSFSCCAAKAPISCPLGAVDFGIIVDSAVILVENIFRNLQKNKGERTGCSIGLPKAPGAATRPRAGTKKPDRHGRTGCG